MAWLRIGDNTVTHPAMSRILEATDLSHQLKNEVFGVLVQLSAVSAAHLTDAWVEMGMLAQIAPGREKQVLDVLCSAGIAERTRVDERWMIRLALDDEEFIHARSREEVMIDRRRSQDKRKSGLYESVRVRDGDECRWCGRTVSWLNRSGNRGGTIDSLTRHENSTVDTLVVACRGCNSRRHEGVELDLREAPDNPYYTDHTIELVNSSRWAQETGVRIEPRQGEIFNASSPGLGRLRQQTDVVAADGRSGSSAPSAAAPKGSGASDNRGASGHHGPGNDPFEDAPEWVTAPVEEVLGRRSVAADGRSGSSAPSAAAPKGSGASGSDEDQIPRQQTDVVAADGQSGDSTSSASPGGSGASDNRGAPGAPPPSITECNEMIKPGTGPGLQGDAARNVGSGRDGPGRAGSGDAAGDRSVRRRRGKRSRR